MSNPVDSAEPCPLCGGELRTAHDVFEAHLGRRTVRVEGTYTRCTSCGEFLFGPGEMDRIQRRAADAIRAEDDLLTSDEIRAIRKRLDLTQPQMEALLGAGEKTVVRWERGTVIQNGATDTLLRVLRDVPAAVDYLMKQRGIERAVRPLFPATVPASYVYAAPHGVEQVPVSPEASQHFSGDAEPFSPDSPYRDVA